MRKISHLFLPILKPQELEETVKALFSPKLYLWITKSAPKKVQLHVALN